MRDLTSLLTTSTDHLPDVPALAEVTTFEPRQRSRGLYKSLVFSQGAEGGTTILLRMDHNLRLSFPPRNF